MLLPPEIMPPPDTKPTLADWGYVLLLTVVIGLVIELGHVFVTIT
jgi:hypothetical protein